MSGPWEPLGGVPAAALRAARLLAHWAVQVPAAFGNGLLPRQADLSHQSLSWDPRERALVSGAVALGGGVPVRAGLRIATLELLLAERRGPVLEHHALVGSTLEEGLLWLADAVHRRGGEDAARRLSLPEHQLPEHDVGLGERFPDADAAAFGELARWYADAHLVLEEVRRANEGASRVRAWPHHFDVATLLPRDPAGPTVPRRAGEEPPTIGVGLSPGDEAYEAPYWYVTPPGTPTAADPLPALAGGGIWNEEVWFGAVLPAELLADEAEEQRAQVEAFLDSAIAAARALA